MAKIRYFCFLLVLILGFPTLAQTIPTTGLYLTTARAKEVDLQDSFSGQLKTWNSERFPWLSAKYPTCWNFDSHPIIGGDPIAWKPSEKCGKDVKKWNIHWEATPTVKERPTVSKWLSPDNKDFREDIKGLKGNRITVFQGHWPEPGVHWYAIVTCPHSLLIPEYFQEADQEETTESLKANTIPADFKNFLQHISCDKEPVRNPK